MIALTPIWKIHESIVSIEATASRPGWERYRQGHHHTTKKWIILAAASNYAEDLTETIAVAPNQRYHNAVTVIKTAARLLGWE